MSEPTQAQPTVSPGGTARPFWHVSRIPAHLGRARTSTVVLAVLFVAIFALYLQVKPATATSGSQVPAQTTAPAAPVTKAPTTTAPQSTTQNQPTRTSTPPATTTGGPSGVPTPTRTPSVTSPTSVPPAPLTAPGTATVSPGG